MLRHSFKKREKRGCVVPAISTGKSEGSRGFLLAEDRNKDFHAQNGTDQNCLLTQTQQGSRKCTAVRVGFYLLCQESPGVPTASLTKWDQTTSTFMPKGMVLCGNSSLHAPAVHRTPVAGGRCAHRTNKSAAGPWIWCCILGDPADM